MILYALVANEFIKRIIVQLTDQLSLTDDQNLKEFDEVCLMRQH